MSGKDQKLDKPIGLAVIALHPVQYHAPLYQEIGKSDILDQTVLYLRPHGYDVLSNSDGKAEPIVWKQDLLSGYRHEFVKNIDLFSKGSGFFSRINFGLISKIFSKRYDVVFVQGYAQFSMWIALFAAKLSGTKIVWRGEVVPRTDDSRPSWKRWIIRSLARFYVSAADAVVYTCSGNRKFLEALDVKLDKFYPFPCAVDNQLMRKSWKEFSVLKNETLEELSIPDDHFIIVCCGRLAQRKRPLDLLKSLQIIDSKMITVLFVGDGPQRAELEQ